MRVTAQLLAADTGEIVWSDKIDVPARDLLDRPGRDRASGCIAGLKPPAHRRGAAPDRPAADRAAPRPTSSTCAGATSSSATSCAPTTRPSSRRRSSMMHEAIGLDPEFARAHATLGRCYVLHAQGWGGRRELRARRALAQARARARPRRSSTPASRWSTWTCTTGDKDQARAASTGSSSRRPDDPRCSSWRACSTVWTASTRRRSRPTTACWS